MSLNYPIYKEINIKKITEFYALDKECSKSLNLLDAILDDLDLEKNSDLEMALECIHDLSTSFKKHDYQFISLGVALKNAYFNDLTNAFISYLYVQKSVKNFLVIGEYDQEIVNHFPFNQEEINIHFENEKSFQLSQNNIIKKYQNFDNLIVIMVDVGKYKTYEFIDVLNKINPLWGLELVDIKSISDYHFKNLVQN